MNASYFFSILFYNEDIKSNSLITRNGGNDMSETYEIIVQNEKSIICNGANGKEEYSLLKEPEENSSLVLDSKKSILQTIQLDELFRNLDNCVSLLDVIYNAVNGVGLSSSVTRLKDKFSKTIDKSLCVTQGFKSKTTESITDFIKAYKFLTDPIYKKGSKNGILMAIDKLVIIGKRANDMEKEATELAASFDEIETLAQEITIKIMDERDMDVKKKEEALKKLEVFNSKKTALENVKKNLAKAESEYSSQYTSLSQKIETNEKRAYTLSIVAAVMGGVSSMFGGGTVTNMNMNTQTTGGGTAQGENQNIQEYRKKEEEIKNLKETISGYEKELAEIKKQLETEEEEAKKEELNKKQDELATNKKNAESDLAKAQGQAEALATVLGGVLGGVNKISGELGDLSTKLDEKNISQYARLDEIAQRKAEVQKQQNETELQLAEMAAEIANATTVSKDLNTCITSLITAIGAMKVVKVYLSDIALFWHNVAKFCNGLVDSVKNLNEEIENFSDVEDYCEIFKEETFVYAFLMNMVNWAALKVVSEEYLRAFLKTRQKYQEFELQGETTPEEHWKKAKEAAATLNKKMKQEVVACQ